MEETVMTISKKENYIVLSRTKDFLITRVANVKLMLDKEKEENLVFFNQSLVDLCHLIQEPLPCSYLYEAMNHKRNYIKCPILKDVLVFINKTAKSKDEQLSIYNAFISLLIETCPEYLDKDVLSKLTLSHVEDAV